MKKKKALKYLNKLFKNAQHNFKSFLQTQSQEALHKFRVEIKKLKSFLTLLEASNQNKKLLKIFKPVKKLFKVTGVIRDAFIHQKQAKENDVEAPQFFKEQNTLQQENRREIIHKKQKYIHSINKAKQTLKSCIHTISKTEIKQFLASQINQTKDLLNSQDFSEQLHNGRKMLKHLLYNRHIIPHIITKQMRIDFNKIDAMQQLLGDWHDNKLALDFFDQKMPAKNLEAMQQMQKNLKEKITIETKVFN